MNLATQVEQTLASNWLEINSGDVGQFQPSLFVFSADHIDFAFAERALAIKKDFEDFMLILCHRTACVARQLLKNTPKLILIETVRYHKK